MISIVFCVRIRSFWVLHGCYTLILLYTYIGRDVPLAIYIFGIFSGRACAPFARAYKQNIYAIVFLVVDATYSSHV